jgi:3-oxoacyl-[acyl-carrier-protein] synthase II
LAISHDLTDPIVTPVTACATGATSSIALGAILLEAGMADVALCGAVDFALVAPIVAGFASMNGAYKSRPGSGRRR